MIMLHVLQAAAAVGADFAEPVQPTADIAGQIKLFIAPVAAILVGLVGLKYLFGENRSLAGFISFLVLGIIVYVLIMWGEPILDRLGSVFRSWVVDENSGPRPEARPWLPWLLVVAAILGSAAAGAVRAFDRGQRRAARAAAPPDMLSDDAGELLAEIGPKDLTALLRLHDQVVLTRALVRRALRGGPDAELTDQHVVKLVVLADRWPDFLRSARDNPGLLASDIPAGTDPGIDESLRQTLRTGPDLVELAHVLLPAAPIRERHSSSPR